MNRRHPGKGRLMESLRHFVISFANGGPFHSSRNTPGMWVGDSQKRLENSRQAVEELLGAFPDRKHLRKHPGRNTLPASMVGPGACSLHRATGSSAAFIPVRTAASHLERTSARVDETPDDAGLAKAMPILMPADGVCLLEAHRLCRKRIPENMKPASANVIIRCRPSTIACHRGRSHGS